MQTTSSQAELAPKSQKGGRVFQAADVVFDMGVSSHVTVAEEMCRASEVRGLTGRGFSWRRDRARIMADLARFAEADHGRPLRTEMGFDPALYPLPDGRTVAFWGSIDRVDERGDDGLTVIDYKTGSTRNYDPSRPEFPPVAGQKTDPVEGDV